MQRTLSVALLSAFAFLLSPLGSAHAAEVPPPQAKPLSAILASAASQDLGTLTSAEFEHGLWEVKACSASACWKLYLDPVTTAEKSRKQTDRSALPPASATSLAAVVKRLEAAHVGVVTDVDFERGYWEVKLAVEATAKDGAR